MRIGLGGIAKGYAVDKAAKVLTDAGVTSFYVQAGGDLFAHGAKARRQPLDGRRAATRGVPRATTSW